MKNSFLLLACFGLFGCGGSKYTPANFPERVITFGKGGGFTGLYTEYFLLENGRLFKKISNQADYTTAGKVSKSITQAIFTAYETAQLDSLQHDEPGNLTYYIVMQSGDQEHRLTWGGGNSPVPEEISSFYQRLTALITPKVARK